MDEVFTGAEARADKKVSKYQLSNHHQRLLPNVYLRAGTTPTARHRIRAAWKWSGEQAIIAGHSAALLHGSKWVDDDRPVELIYANRHRRPGFIVHSVRISDDEITTIDDLKVTSVARTMFDLARWHDQTTAVIAIDALVQATKADPADALLLAGPCKGRRSIAAARRTLSLVDGGAQSPPESRLRLFLGSRGFPPVQTQIPIRSADGGRVLFYLDMGWPEWKIAIEYDGDQHRTNRSQYSYDRHRIKALEDDGWIIIRVTSTDSKATIARWVNDALAQRRR